MAVIGCGYIRIHQMCILWLYNRGWRPSQWPPEHLDVQLAPNGQYPALLHVYIIHCTTATSHPALLLHHTLHCYYIIHCTDATSYIALHCSVTLGTSLVSSSHTDIQYVWGEDKIWWIQWSHQYQFRYLMIIQYEFIYPMATSNVIKMLFHIKSISNHHTISNPILMITQ